MAINESVQYALAQTNWRSRTLVEVANAGQLFTITEAEFDAILEAEQIDEGVKEWIAKAREFAAKLPGNIQAAQQAVVKATGKALDASNAAYVKAQNIINKIPLIGRIPETTRNRLMLGLALSFAAGMGTDASAGENGATDATGSHAPNADQTTGGNEGGGGAGGEEPQPQPKVTTFQADLSGVDVRKDMVALKKELAQTLGDKAYTDQMMGSSLQQMLMAAKKAGSVADPEEKQQLIGLAKQIAKGILYRTDEAKAEAVGKALTKAMIGALKSGKGTP